MPGASSLYRNAIFKNLEDLSRESIRNSNESKIDVAYNLPMADSIILATAQEFKAILWTQDSDFKKINNVKYFPKK